MKPMCTGCNRTPEQIPEYVDLAQVEGVTPEGFVRTEEGTFNRENGHFLCTDCYVARGMPSSPAGWVAP